MLSPTLREGLKAYAIGPKIRSIRLKKKMGLVELGKHTGLSPAMLSKIERGQLFPTLPTLLRIAMVFSVGLDYFIAADRDQPVVGISRHQERMRFPEKAGGKDQAYEFESLDFPAVQRLLNSYFAEFFAVAADELRRHRHPGAEFIYVLSGTLILHIGDEEHTLEARDSIYFDSTVPHAYRKSGAKACCALVVTTG
ncbi:MAG TPA: XRE family transcriptional regulator [Vicinamibacterales bacterium]|nr:XRE family transcriptional regulator [Vicinamibacterales bacterium]